MKDPDIEDGEEQAYECFECGKIVTATQSPGTCPGCGGELRNRSYPLE